MPEKIVFILSTSRTGTKSLAEGLAGQDICSPHQPPFSRLLTIVSNCYLHGWIPRNLLEWFVTQFRLRQILNVDKPYYIQTFSLDYLPAKIISEKYPNVYIVHIVRDPRTFVRSYMNWMHTRFKSFVANKLAPAWHPSGYFTGEMPWKVWRQMDEFQRVCWHWKYKNTLLETLFADDDRYIRVRFEDLFLTGDATILKEVLFLVGIPYEKRFETVVVRSRNVSQKTYLSHWDTWESEMQHCLFKICGDKMKDYGYF